VSTYTPIATITVTNSTTNVIDFTNIPQNYTDLVVVGSFFTGNSSLGVRVGNGSFDTGNNYSNTVLRGDSSGAVSNRGTNGSLVDVGNGYADQGATIVLNFQNYSNTTTNKTFLGRWAGRWSAGGTYVNATVNLWRSTSAINQIRLYNYAGSTVYFTNGSTFNLYGIASGGPKAFGGDVVATDGTYWYHAFRSSAMFTTTQELTVDCLLVAGGGGGGWDAFSGGRAAGGGGAGGFLGLSAQVLSKGSYAVAIGAGGVSSVVGWDGNGNNSSLGALSQAIGGGGGGGNDTAGSSQNGGNGGSGGGAASGSTPGSGTAGQGNAGANNGAGGNTAGGGGGGAGAAGSQGPSGAGGIGLNTYSSWASVTGTGASGYYAGGGGGMTSGSGGAGGGGTASTGTGGSGTANTGGGGGGGRAGGTGGSGIVIVRYAV